MLVHDARLRDDAHTHGTMLMREQVAACIDECSRTHAQDNIHVADGHDAQQTEACCGWRDAQDLGALRAHERNCVIHCCARRYAHKLFHVGQRQGSRGRMNPLQLVIHKQRGWVCSW